MHFFAPVTGFAFLRDPDIGGEKERGLLSGADMKIVAGAALTAIA
jgi:hypothetical protein